MKCWWSFSNCPRMVFSLFSLSTYSPCSTPGLLLCSAARQMTFCVLCDTRRTHADRTLVAGRGSFFLTCASRSTIQRQLSLLSCTTTTVEVFAWCGSLPPSLSPCILSTLPISTAVSATSHHSSYLHGSHNTTLLHPLHASRVAVTQSQNRQRSHSVGIPGQAGRAAPLAAL